MKFRIVVRRHGSISEYSPEVKKGFWEDWEGIYPSAPEMVNINPEDVRHWDTFEGGVWYKDKRDAERVINAYKAIHEPIRYEYSFIKIATVLMFVLYCASASGQIEPGPTKEIMTRKDVNYPYKNSIAPMLQLDSYSWGARYERRGESIGAYVYGITGDYYMNPSGIKDETSFGSGILFMPAYWEYPYAPAITMGFNYSWYTYYESSEPFANTHADMPISLDLGLSAQHGRVNFGINADICKWRFMLFAGVNF